MICWYLFAAILALMVAKGKALECFKCIATEPEDCKSGKCESWFGCFTRISKQESDGRARIVQRGCKLDTARDECTTEESANIKYDVCDCKKNYCNDKEAWPPGRTQCKCSPQRCGAGGLCFAESCVTELCTFPLAKRSISTTYCADQKQNDGECKNLTVTADQNGVKKYCTVCYCNGTECNWNNKMPDSVLKYHNELKNSGNEILIINKFCAIIAMVGAMIMTH